MINVQKCPAQNLSALSVGKTCIFIHKKTIARMAAAPPLPALQVTTAAFFHLDCSHPQLFQPEYKR